MTFSFSHCTQTHYFHGFSCNGLLSISLLHLMKIPLNNMVPISRYSVPNHPQRANSIYDLLLGELGGRILIYSNCIFMLHVRLLVCSWLWNETYLLQTFFAPCYGRVVRFSDWCTVQNAFDCSQELKRFTRSFLIFWIFRFTTEIYLWDWK